MGLASSSQGSPGAGLPVGSFLGAVRSLWPILPHFQFGDFKSIPFCVSSIELSLEQFFRSLFIFPAGLPGCFRQIAGFFDPSTTMSGIHKASQAGSQLIYNFLNISKSRVSNFVL